MEGENVSFTINCIIAEESLDKFRQYLLELAILSVH